MSSQITVLNVLFRGLMNEYDDDEEEDEDEEMSIIESKTHEIIDEISRLQPYRYPSLSLEYYGDQGHIELVFKFRITWMDRESDMNDYLDDVQNTIESGMNMIVNERESLGYTTR